MLSRKPRISFMGGFRRAGHQARHRFRLMGPQPLNFSINRRARLDPVSSDPQIRLGVSLACSCDRQTNLMAISVPFCRSEHSSSHIQITFGLVKVPHRWGVLSRVRVRDF